MTCPTKLRNFAIRPQITRHLDRQPGLAGIEPELQRLTGRRSQPLPGSQK